MLARISDIAFARTRMPFGATGTQPEPSRTRRISFQRKKRSQGDEVVLGTGPRTLKRSRSAKAGSRYAASSVWVGAAEDGASGLPYGKMGAFAMSSPDLTTPADEFGDWHIVQTRPTSAALAAVQGTILGELRLFPAD